MDQTKEHILIRSNGSQNFFDRTDDVVRWEDLGDYIEVFYRGAHAGVPSSSGYEYRRENVRIYTQISEHDIHPLDEVKVDGAIWTNVTKIWVLSWEGAPSQVRYTIARINKNGETKLHRRVAGQLDVREASAAQIKSQLVIDYVCEEVFDYAYRQGAEICINDKGYEEWFGEGESGIAAQLATIWQWLPRAPEGSALEAFLSGDCDATTGASAEVVMPFRSNFDQREAIKSALRHQISIIDGPPGTGKTQTILNLIATLICQGKRVGIVAGANSAVQNVVDKLTEEGFGFLLANLGNREHVDQFWADQEKLQKLEEEWRSAVLPDVDAKLLPMFKERLRQSENTLVSSWVSSRKIPRLRAQLREMERERGIFEEKLSRSGLELPDLSDYAFAQADATLIGDLLARALVQPRLPRGIKGLIERWQRYRIYGSLKGLDLSDANVQSAIQLLLYQVVEREAEEHLNVELEKSLDNQNDQVSRSYRDYARKVFNASLLRRLASDEENVLDENERINEQTEDLLNRFPIVASTCFSIRNNLANDVLLDWIIIDEASQVILPQGFAALSKAKNAVIVGDEKQIGPILSGWEESDHEPPNERFDVRKLSLLAATKMLAHSANVPSTLLTEHYRCHPAIIEFCNRMYYDGQLVAMSEPSEDAPPPFQVIYASPGHHSRKLHGERKKKRRYSQREIDIIAELKEMRVLREELDLDGVDASGDFLLGVVTPYREQANRIAERLKGELPAPNDPRLLVETAHKFQGRGAGIVVLSTVLDSEDEAARNEYYDDDRLTNVAVSRAKEQLIVVTAKNGVRKSHNIRALLDYIETYDPSAVTHSEIVSVFDVLYPTYSASLERYARAKSKGKGESPAENVAFELLKEILQIPIYSAFKCQMHLPLRGILPNTEKLDDEQRAFVYTDSAIDFGISSKVSSRLLLAIEVDGVAFHENNPEQLRRDRMKDEILGLYGVPILRLPTNGSGEEKRIRNALDALLE